MSRLRSEAYKVNDELKAVESSPFYVGIGLSNLIFRGLLDFLNINTNMQNDSFNFWCLRLQMGSVVVLRGE